MRERLIELLKQADEKCNSIKQCKNCIGFGKGEDCLNFLISDYLITNGVIVPPCKVGQVVYQIYWDFRIDKCKVSALTQKSDESFKIRVTSGINRSVFEVTPDRLGKTVFLTREEAEKALKEREGK